MGGKQKRLYLCAVIIFLVVLLYMLRLQFARPLTSNVDSDIVVQTLNKDPSRPDVVSNTQNDCKNLNDIPFRHNGEKHIMFIFHNAEPHGSLQRNFEKCLDSIFNHTRVPMSKFTCHIIGDDRSFDVAKDVFKGLRLSDFVKLEYHSSDDLVEKARNLLKPLLRSLSSRKHRFSDPLFLMSSVLHRFLPRSISQLILLDVDLIFKSDIGQLFDLFSLFSDRQVLGVARENQPVYRHVFRDYRLGHPGTKVGEPPPDGLTGVNSGVLLLDMDKLRCSQAYNSFFLPDVVPSLVQKYAFRANLGDQDFYTLLQFEKPDLLYILPCGWNRQLCRWWRMDTLADVFDLFYRCDGQVHVFHGNCKTNITGVV